MSTLALTAPFERPRPDDRIATAPPSLPLSAPVLISDCVTPLGGETLLSLILRRLAERD